MNDDVLPRGGRQWDDPPRVLVENDLSYKVRVRASNSPVYLWGSANITLPISFPTAPLFHVLNHPLGQPISFGTTPPGVGTPIGTLDPGECVSIPLQVTTGQAVGGIAGVWAICSTTVTIVRCFVKT